MKARRIRRLVGFIILLVSVCILLWGVWDYGTVTQTMPVSPQDMQLPALLAPGLGLVYRLGVFHAA